MIRKLFIPVLVVVASIFGAVTLMATAPELEPSTIEPIATTVRVREVVPQPIQLTVHSQGTVVPNTESELIPEVSGRVVWMSPALVNGGYFESGDVLLRLDDRDHRSLLERARANLNRAEAEFEHARFEYQRLKSLEERQLVVAEEVIVVPGQLLLAEDLGHMCIPLEGHLEGNAADLPVDLAIT